MYGVRPWVQTGVSGNRPLMKKKLAVVMQKKPSQCLSLSSRTFSLVLSVSLYLPSLPAESEFSNRPRLNFLTALSGCQSRPGSPALKPSQQLGQ